MKIGLLNIRLDDENIPNFLPSGLDYIGSFLKANNPEHEVIIDYNLYRLVNQKPDIVGLSSFSITYPLSCYVAQYIKKYLNVPIIMGGNHITALPETLDENMDVGVLGEGEHTFLEIVKLFSESKFNEENLSKINGVVFRDKNKNFIKTPKRSLISDIDTLPIPSRVIVDNVKGHWQHSIFTSRGCPYNCKYCSNSSFWGGIRFHSVERVITELSNLVSKNNQEKMFITIQDDLFSINKTRLENIVKAIKKEKLDKRIDFTCNARANLFDREICQLFKEMNINAIVFGMESANDRILNYMKGSSSGKQNQEAIDICKEFNIMCIPNFIVGFPTETKKEASDSYWFIRKNLNNVGEVRVFPATPFPNTYLWDYAINEGLIPQNFSYWEALNLKYVPNKSVYLNKEYSEKDYQDMLSEFYNLVSNIKFDINQQNYVEKSKYNDFILNLISQYISSDLGINDILEISFLDDSIKNKMDKNISTGYIKNNKIDIKHLENKKFDAIFLLHSLELLKNPKKELELLKNKLKPNGSLLLLWSNIQNPLSLLNLLNNSDINNFRLFDNKEISFFSEKKIENLAKEVNLNIAQQIKIPLNLGEIENNKYLQIKNLLDKYCSLPDKSFISCISKLIF